MTQVTHNDPARFDKQEQGGSSYRECTGLHVERNHNADYLFTLEGDRIGPDNRPDLDVWLHEQPGV